MYEFMSDIKKVDLGGGASIYIYIHGGPTGMVVANMAVHGPFFQPANVEGTGSHHSWL